MYQLQILNFRGQLITNYTLSTYEQNGNHTHRVDVKNE